MIYLIKNNSSKAIMKEGKYLNFDFHLLAQIEDVATQSRFTNAWNKLEKAKKWQHNRAFTKA